VRRADGTEETLTVDIPLGERPQLGVLLHEGRVLRAVARTAADFLEKDDVLLAVDGSAIEDLGVWRAAAGSDPVGSVTVRRDDRELTLAPPRPISRKELADSVSGLPERASNRLAVRPGLPAERAGLRTGDRVLKVGDEEVKGWDGIAGAVAAQREGPVVLTVERDGKELVLSVVPGHFPRDEDRFLGYEVAPSTFLHKETTVPGALATGWRRTVVFGRAVVLTVRSLVTQRVSARQVHGPLMLAKVTYSMFAHGLGRYLYILAMISINLAVLNLLPIPVLDGGQIVLLCAEKLRGKPLPERVVGYYQIVGLVLILGLLALALSNDVRFFIVN
jgi:regulator of sigma E protease